MNIELLLREAWGVRRHSYKLVGKLLCWLLSHRRHRVPSLRKMHRQALLIVCAEPLPVFSFCLARFFCCACFGASCTLQRGNTHISIMFGTTLVPSCRLLFRIGFACGLIVYRQRSMQLFCQNNHDWLLVWLLAWLLVWLSVLQFVCSVAQYRWNTVESFTILFEICLGFGMFMELHL